MQLIDQVIDGGGSLLLGDVGQSGIACGGGWTGMTEQALDMTQTQALLKQMGGKGMSERMDGDFFLIPHCVTMAFMVAWTLPRSICLVAWRIRSGEPTALGNNKFG